MTYPAGQNRDTNSSNSSDCMDMHADSPGHDFPYWSSLWSYLESVIGKRRSFVKTVEKCLVKNYKIIVDKLQCVWVPLFSSLKLGTSVYFVRSYGKKKSWPHNYWFREV
jgi:hypothetical protein